MPNSSGGAVFSASQAFLKTTYSTPSEPLVFRRERGLVHQGLRGGRVDDPVAGEGSVDEVDSHRAGERLVDAAEELHVAGINGGGDVLVARVVAWRSCSSGSSLGRRRHEETGEG